MNFRQGEPTPEEMLSDPIVRVRYGGGRDRPARTRGHSETDRPDAGPANASRGTPSPCWFNAPAGQVYANLISADTHTMAQAQPRRFRETGKLERALPFVCTPKGTRSIAKTEWGLQQCLRLRVVGIIFIARRYGGGAQSISCVRSHCARCA
jgi:hypothetical protein